MGTIGFGVGNAVLAAELKAPEPAPLEQLPQFFLRRGLLASQLAREFEQVRRKDGDFLHYWDCKVKGPSSQPFSQREKGFYRSN